MTIRREFVGAKPCTTPALTETGRDAVESCPTALRALLRVLDGAGR
ncbi:MAG: hypothetical protein IPM29_02330 [Planctomycetes bacterium]|nr:hypothetical protein [Planctomycetota bacterium]